MTGWLPPGFETWGDHPVAHSVAEASPRRRIALTATVVSAKCRYRPALVFEAEVDDGTGRLVLGWLGRDHIPGVGRGALLRVEGTVLLLHGRRVVLNPLYEPCSPPG